MTCDTTATITYGKVTVEDDGTIAVKESALSEAISKYRQSRTPTSLATYLYIYNHAWYDSYINYMEGAKALAKYLAPIDIRMVCNTTIPQMLMSYDLQQLSIVLKPHTVNALSTSQIENAIYEYLTKPR